MGDDGSTRSLSIIELSGAIMLWLIAFSIICIVGAFFMHRFERRLKRLTGPWMIGK
jgi:hypothetical protein